MKILKLSVKNISSLADVTIDFTAAPLSDASIFLINGPTGAGKSTILNAICLALFNEAPCLNRAKPASKSNDEVKSNSTQNMLRYGTAAGSVELLFLDNQGDQYTASWSVKRSRGKLDGKLQKISRKLYCEKTGEGLVNYKDIDTKVAEIIGLNFEQFCRTTMLAQGEFSRFLHGTDEEKGEILEKLTGMKRYSDISIAIYEKHKEISEAIRYLEKEIEGANLLTEADIKEKQARVAELATLLEKTEKEVQTLAEAVAWFNSIKTATARLADSKGKMQQAIDALQSKEISEAKANAGLWDMTDEIRKLLEKAKETESELKESTDASNQHKANFATIIAGLLFLEKSSDDIRQGELAPTQKAIAELAPKEAFFREASGIETSANQIDAKLQQIETQKKEITSIDTEIKKLDTPIAEAEEKAKAAAEVLEQCKQKLDLCNDALKGVDLEAISNEVDALTTKIDNAKTAIQDLADVANCRDTANDIAELLKADAEKLNACKSQYKSDTEALEKAKSTLKEKQEEYKRASTLVTYIAELQQALEKHGTCPVCGSKVEHLHSTAEIDETIAKIQTEVKEADSKVQSLQKQVSDCGAQIRSLESSIKDKEKSLTAAQEKLAVAESKCKKSVAECKIDTAEKLTELLERLKAEHASKSDLKRQALAKQKDRDKALKDKDAAQANFDKADWQVKKHKEKVDELDSKKRVAISVISGYHQDIRDSLESISKKLDGKAECTFDTYRQIAKEAADMNAQWESLNKEKTTLENKIKDLESLHKNTANLIKDINLPTPDGIAPAKLANIYSVATSLVKDMSEHKGKVDSLTQQLGDTRAKIERFYLDNPDITEEMATTAAAFTPAQVSAWKEAYDKARKDKTLAEGELAASTRNYEEAMAKKPAICEDKSEEELQAEKHETEVRKNTIISEGATIESELTQNEKRRESVAVQQELLKAKKEEWSKWDILNGLFGAADGKKFKVIAQCNVLRVLLKNANYYMQTLAPRYTLYCQPDSLTIMVKDAYNGNAIRHSTGLSGGETFAVSLALALGLAQITPDRNRGGILFIDEGFGSLSSDYLNSAIDTLHALNRLHSVKVGIISHVESMAEQIPVQIKVQPQNNGASTVTITG